MKLTSVQTKEIDEILSLIEDELTFEDELTSDNKPKEDSSLYQIISKHSGQSFEKVHMDSERDYWMIADEAKEYGMIDEVLRRV